MNLTIPKNYKSTLTLNETQDAIKYIRDTFQKEFAKEKPIIARAVRATLIAVYKPEPIFEMILEHNKLDMMVNTEISIVIIPA